MREKLRLPEDFRKRPATAAWGGLGWALALLFGGLYLADAGPAERAHVPVRPEPRPQALSAPVVLRCSPKPAVERIERLLAQHQPQQALAEIARTWADCEHRHEAPPAELPDLFARSVADLQQSRPHWPPPPHEPLAPTALPGAGERAPRLANLPGPGYPLARPRIKAPAPAAELPPLDLPPLDLPPLPPPPPFATGFEGPPGQPPPPPGPGNPGWPSGPAVNCPSSPPGY